ncbi:MAG: hypothetical protein ABFD50_00565 [Smithella sp.]
MKKKSCIILIIFIMFFVNNAVADIDALNQAYKEQYIKLNNENNGLQLLIKIYSSCIEKINILDVRLLDLDEDIRTGQKYRRDTLQDRINITENKIEILTSTLQVFNKYKNENRSDISLDEIKIELELNRRRIKEIEDKKQELKIKILEKKGALPDWWKE